MTPTRRRLLGSLGAVATASVAGCLGGDDEDDTSGPDEGGDEGNESDQNGESDDQNNGDETDDQDGENDDENGNGDQNGEDPGEVPGEEEAIGVVDAYLAAISDGDPELFASVIHPDSPLSTRFSAQEIQQTGELLNYQYRNMEVTELDREAGTAVVEYDLAIIVEDRDPETTEAREELRVHNGRWRIWLTTPPATGDTDG